jgi:hypothetical protein
VLVDVNVVVLALDVRDAPIALVEHSRPHALVE